jgi:RND superfamily putative drug exporter
MFGKLGRLVVGNPWKVIAAWLLATIAIVAFAPSLADVTNADQAEFLPDRYESIQAQQLAERAFAKSAAATAAIVVKRADGQPLTAADQATVGRIPELVKKADIERLTEAVTGPQAVSPNKKVQLVNVGFEGLPDDPKISEAVIKVRTAAKPALDGTDLRMAVTGDAAFFSDNKDAFDDALVIVGIVTLVLIVTLLLLIYRSPIAAVLPVVSVGVVSTVSPPLIALAAKAFGLQVDQSLPTILTVVLFGVGTDYIVFLLFRYRERLRAGDEPKQALITAVERVGEVIASAAGAIVIAFSALLLAVFGGFRSLGPGLAIAVIVMAFAAITLVPALVSLIGPKVFWPSKSWQRVPKGTAFQRLGRFTGRRPGVVALASGGVMVLLALGTLGFNTDYDQLGQLPSGTESSQGMVDLQSGFPPGALNPTSVYVRSDNGQPLSATELTAYAQKLRTVEGVGGIMPSGADGSPALLSKDGKTAKIDLLLAKGPYTNESLDAAEGPIRDAAHAEAPDGTTALVGGATAQFADIRDANSRDLTVIFPVAGVLIAVILGLMLRSVVAPLYLMAAVVLGFFSTLGATVIAFQGIGDRAGVTFSLPIILYLFVVAIGTDYNILMIARLREEAREGHEPRLAADLAVEHGGPSIAAAGVILAGTFASLMLGGVSLLTEMGFAVSVGIMISAFVMSMFLVPAVTALLGHAAWWPGHGDAARVAAAEPEPVKVGV